MLVYRWVLKSKAAGLTSVKRITVLFPTKAPLSSLFVFLRAFVCTRPSTYCTCGTEIALCRHARCLAGGGGGGLRLGAATLSPRSRQTRGRTFIAFAVERGFRSRKFSLLSRILVERKRFLCHFASQLNFKCLTTLPCVYYLRAARK